MEKSNENEVTNEVKTLVVQVKDVFGVKRVYPVSGDGILLLELCGTKSFSDEHILIIKRLGYTISVLSPQLGEA